MSRRRRWIERFTDVNGTNAVEFSAIEREWQPSQALQTPTAEVIGADYEYDHLGYGPARKRAAVERVRFVIADVGAENLDDQVDRLQGTLYRLGRGKLWTNTEEGARRWAWARLDRMADIRYGQANRDHLPVSLEFKRLSDWFAEHPVVVRRHVTLSPQDIPVNNHGTTVSRGVVIEFHSRSVAAFQAFSLTNVSTGESFTSSRVAESNQSILRVDCGRYTVEYTNDDGETWLNDWANLSYGAAQAALMRLETGFNTLEYEQAVGAPDVDVTVTFNAAYS